MERAALISALLDLPIRPLLGLTLRNQRMRERSAETVATDLLERLEPQDAVHRDQLALPL